MAARHRVGGELTDPRRTGGEVAARHRVGGELTDRRHTRGEVAARHRVGGELTDRRHTRGVASDLMEQGCDSEVTEPVASPRHFSLSRVVHRRGWGDG